MTNISSAPGVATVAGLVQAPVVAAAADTLARPPRPRARTGRAPTPRARGPRVIVVEPAPGTPGARTDRLDGELDVVARIPMPLTAAQLGATLAAARPRALLWKHSLDGLDEQVLAVCRAHRAAVFVLANPVYGLLRPMRLRRYGGLPWLRLRPGGVRSLDVKRLVDLSLALLSAPVSVPLMLLITLAVSASGPPFYLQDRVGEGGRGFRMVKFRTMTVDAERDTGPALATPGDARVTRVGRVLRRTRLDELPQLWNVLRGQMSLVGPRPERPEFVAELRRLPDYELRHLIRPGLTGIAQLTGGYAATAEEKLRCDLLYLHCRSVRFDLKLLLLTVVELLRGFPRG